LQQGLADWQTAVDDARGRLYFLNYFTVRELCTLVETMPKIANSEPAWTQVWMLLRCVDVTADENALRTKVTKTWAELKKSFEDRGEISEVAKLNLLGTLLERLFKDSEPIVRTLATWSLQECSCRAIS
jgi:hypothetical protein